MFDDKQIVPYSLKDAPALIEKLFPVQKLSAEVFKERKAGAGQTLVPLGAYWKGRKPLILNKACILGCLLPVTNDLKRDLEIFEKLMAMDEESFVVRWKRRAKPEKILSTLYINDVNAYFISDPPNKLPDTSPIDWSRPEFQGVKVQWRDEITELERRKLEVEILPVESYRKKVEMANRPEEVGDDVHVHIWDSVNNHLKTCAYSIPELVTQLGIMRFGRCPRVADTFSGSGQIPFEAARLGCDVYASDLNPIACMLTWASFHIVGATPQERIETEKSQKELASKIQKEIDKLGIEADGSGWRAKTYLYCLEVRCQQSGWKVPLLPSRLISYGKQAIAELVPIPSEKRYAIMIRSGVSHADMSTASIGTLRSDGRGQEPYLLHTVNGIEYRTKISTLRGDFRNEDGSNNNKLRLWEKSDFKPRPDDIFQERLYAIHWMKPVKNGKTFEYKFTSVTNADLERERIVDDFISSNLEEWQSKGWIPEMKIEAGAKTDEPIRTRGWTHWHHLFPPRHLILLGLILKFSNKENTYVMLSRILNYAGKLCIWSTSKPGTSKPGDGGRTGGGSDNSVNVFYNQALNTLFNYGCRASFPLLEMLNLELSTASCPGTLKVSCHSAFEINHENDIYITDPPYGDAVKYEEILEFFIAWLRKNPPPEFADWVWDSRRTLALKGEDEDFRRGMVASYKRMAEKMPDNGIQVIMFTHQSGSIWADMANIVWASGLHVTAAWYVVTETDSALREGSYVKGTVLLVLRKKHGNLKTNRGDLAWEIQEEVEEQVKTLTGLNQEAKDLYRDENLFLDADLQMAGYAAALRVLTRYSIIDGKEMEIEAVRPRIKGQLTFIDDLIDFAVGVANQYLVPQNIDKAHWDNLQPTERFYIKMLDLEAQGAKKIDNYQNFAKAFKVKNFKPMMASEKANAAKLKSAADFGKSDMSGDSEFANTTIRGVLYGIWELQQDIEGDKVIAHLGENVANYYRQRKIIVELADYLARKLENMRPEEASSARVLRDLVRNQKMG